MADDGYQESVLEAMRTSSNPITKRWLATLDYERARHERELAERDAEIGRLREALAACGRAGCPTAAALSSAPPQAKPVAEHKPGCRTNCRYWPKPFDACLEHPDGHACDCGATREKKS